jgi:hypothetical protein
LAEPVSGRLRILLIPQPVCPPVLEAPATRQERRFYPTRRAERDDNIGL